MHSLACPWRSAFTWCWQLPTEWSLRPWSRLTNVGALGPLVPAFAPPRRYADAAALDIPNRVDGVFGERIALLGFDVQPASLEPGQTVKVTLYLSAPRPVTETYSIGLWFVSAVPGETSRLVGLDTWPGHGNYPTTAWNPGEVVVDRYRLRVPREVERAQAWVLQTSTWCQCHPTWRQATPLFTWAGTTLSPARGCPWAAATISIWGSRT